MARQEFLSGGFVGKLGATVGQRWHNKRTVRTWVKTPNPNTPNQQETRGLFRHAVLLAQEAMRINKGDPAWDTSHCGEFALRVGTAKRRLQAGMTDSQALPLYPDGYNPPTTGNVQVAYPVGRYFQVRLQAPIPDSLIGRTLRIAVVLTNPAGSIITDFEWEETISSSVFAFEYRMPAGTLFGIGTHITVNIDSVDDGGGNPHITIPTYSVDYDTSLYGTYVQPDDAAIGAQVLLFSFDNGSWESTNTKILGSIATMEPMPNYDRMQTFRRFIYNFFEDSGFLRLFENSGPNTYFQNRTIYFFFATDLRNTPPSAVLNYTSGVGTWAGDSWDMDCYSRLPVFCNTSLPDN